MWLCQNKTETVSVMIAWDNIVCGGVLWWLGCRYCGGKGNIVLASGWGIWKFPVRCCGWVSCCYDNCEDYERRGLFDIDNGCSRAENEGATYT